MQQQQPTTAPAPLPRRDICRAQARGWEGQGGWPRKHHISCASHIVTWCHVPTLWEARYWPSGAAFSARTWAGIRPFSVPVWAATICGYWRPFRGLPSHALPHTLTLFHMRHYARARVALACCLQRLPRVAVLVATNGCCTITVPTENLHPGEAVGLLCTVCHTRQHHRRLAILVQGVGRSTHVV